MKSFSQFKESIIDIPRRTYAPGVFDNEDTDNPKIKDSVLRIINDTIEKEYTPFGDVKRVALIGSIITKRYRADADLDLDIFMELNDSSEEMRRKLVSKTMGELNGKLIPGTKHPINYYVQVNKKVSDEHIEEADGIFDVRQNKFTKRPKEFKFDVNLYLKDFQKQVDKIDILKGELKRDIIDYDELIDLKTGEIRDLEKRVKGKLDEIEESLKSLSDIGSKVDSDRKSAFLDDMTPDEIKTFSIKNRLPANVIYKMLEKYHYTTFLKKCKMILDDGKVTDAEIDSLRKEHTQSDARVVGEALDKNNTLVFAFGRFNPPTVGHAKLMSKVITEAQSNRANHIVYASASTDKRSNPLDVNTKVKFMKKMFPKNNIKAAGGNERTFIEILKFFDKMYGNIIMIAGSDRVGEFQKLSNKYNGKDYNYKSIKLVSSGERDPDAEGVTGMSASKMREMAKNNDYRNFKLGVSNLSDKDSKALFDAVKKGMGIRERYENFTNYLNNDIREEYHQERLFNIGDMVEHMDGTNGMIVRRGSNYVSYETEEGLIKKAWLYDIQEGPRIPRKKGQPAGSDKHSDLYTDENPKGTIKGLGFKDVETAKASVSKIKNSGKTHAHKIQAAIAMEQRAKVMGKKSEAAVYRKFIDQMKEKTKQMKKESLIDTLEEEMSNESIDTIIRHLRRFTIDRKKIKSGIEQFKDMVSKGIEKQKALLDVSSFIGVPARELRDSLTSAGLFEYYLIGTDYSAYHTMKMTPGQPIQNFRKVTDKITKKDIEKFKNEDETIDKYKKRFKENWKIELDKAVEKMREQL